MQPVSYNNISDALKFEINIANRVGEGKFMEVMRLSEAKEGELNGDLEDLSNRDNRLRVVHDHLEAQAKASS